MSLRSPQLRLSGSKWLWLWGVWLGAQPPSPLPEAYEALRRGLTLNAQRLLERAREHPDSLVRWEAALLQGTIAARAGRESEALRHWYFVSQQSPHSPLGVEATYRRADLLLRNRSQWAAALYLLRTLLESPFTPPDLRSHVEDRLTHFAYREADLGFLWYYTAESGESALYPYLAPALSYHLRQACFWPLWRSWHAQQAARCGYPPDSLSWQQLTDSLPTETLRVVLLLPLMASQERNSPFLEFWQGFELGLTEARSPYAVWQVEVEDSERNPARLQSLFSQWEAAPPHILVGEVSWSLNQLVADFCTRKGIWHAVPINSAVPRRPYTFPLVLPAVCHGEQLAQLIRDSLPTARGAILYEADDPQAVAYVEGFRGQKWVPAYALPSRIADLTRRWATLRDSVKDLDWYFLAVSQEELLGFLLHKMGRDTLQPLVIGMESWTNLQHIELKDYWRMRIWVPQSLLPDSAAWEAFSQKVRRYLYQRPTLYHAQGYDAARWLAHLSSAYQRGQLPPQKEYGGLLNRYLLPPTCSGYRWRLWEYARGERRIRYERL